MSNGETFQRIRDSVNEDDSPAVLVCSDASGAPVAANQTARRFVPAEGIAAWSDLLVASDCEDWSTAIHRSCIDSAPVVGSYRFRRFDNAVRRFVVRAEPRYDSVGKFVGHIVSAMDISDIWQGLDSGENSIVKEIAGGWHDRLVSISTVVSVSTELIRDLSPTDVSPMFRAAMDKLSVAVADLRTQIQTLSSVSRSRD